MEFHICQGAVFRVEYTDIFFVLFDGVENVWIFCNDAVRKHNMVVPVSLRSVFLFEKRHFTAIHGLGKRSCKNGIDLSVSGKFYRIVYGTCIVESAIESIPCTDKYAERSSPFLPVIVLCKRVECTTKFHLPGLFLCCPMP